MSGGDEEQDWRLGCPVCFATPSEACVTPAGMPRPDHVARIRQAEKEREGREDADQELAAYAHRLEGCT